jgi:hypothetical protein
MGVGGEEDRYTSTSPRGTTHRVVDIVTATGQIPHPRHHHGSSTYKTVGIEQHQRRNNTKILFL